MSANGYLLFISKPTGYELRERQGDLPGVGQEIEDDGARLRRLEDRTFAAAGRPASLRLHSSRSAEAPARDADLEAVRACPCGRLNLVSGRERVATINPSSQRSVRPRSAERKRGGESAGVAAGRPAAGVDSGRVEPLDRWSRFG